MTYSNHPKQNAAVFYLKMLLYMALALLVRLAALAPLAFLRAEGALRWLALLCPAALVFLVLPLRFSFAEALVSQPEGDGFSLSGAFSLRDYGEKLKQSALHALHVAMWGIPLVVMLGCAWYWYNEVDALTLLQTVTGLGKNWSEGYCAVRNAVCGLFGAEALVPPANTMMDGVLVLLAALAAGVLFWLYGAARNSATRYIWVLANRYDRSPYREVRRRLLGRRWAQLGVTLLNGVLCLPFLIATALLLKTAVSDLANTLMMAITVGKLPTLNIMAILLPLSLCFVGLYLTLLPVRRLLTARFAVSEKGRVASGKGRAA